MKKNGVDERLWIFVILVISLSFLFYSLDQLSISYKESVVYFDAHTPLHFIVKFSCYLFGQNDFALRLPMVFLHIANVLLIHNVSKQFLKNPIDRIIALCVYAMLPGVNVAALVVNEANLVIFISLLFILLWQRKYFTYAYILLILSLAFDNSFSVFYISLLFYGLAKKHTMLFSLALILFSVSMYIYGFDTHGKPKGYFLDTIGIYAATLSPLIFIYYVYALYRITIKEKKDILWFVCFGAFVVSMLFSFRQRLYLEDFLPFAAIGVPLIVKIFLNSYRVRLPIHRRFHKIILGVIMLSLLFAFFTIHANKFLYFVYDNPKKHFAYKYHMAKELADWLKAKGITSLSVEDVKLAKRLQFYGISHGDKLLLKKVDLKDNSAKLFRFDFASKPIIRYGIFSL